MAESAVILIDRSAHLINGERFGIIGRIGEASCGAAAVPVYMALHITDVNADASNVNDLRVALKYVDVDAEPEIFNKMQSQVAMNSALINGRQSNIVGITKSFRDGRYFCVVFLLKESGSIRRSPALTRPRPLSEKCITFILYETLKALADIHGCGLVHEEISVGCIFVNRRGEVRVGFAASAYDDHDSYHEAPAELHGSEKGDVWRVGITALELAYRVWKREELDSMVKNIKKTKKLPAREKFAGGLGFVPTLSSCFGGDGMRRFSKGFEDFVVKCLEKRPSANELLHYKIFDKVRAWGVLPRSIHLFQ